MIELVYHESGLQVLLQSYTEFQTIPQPNPATVNPKKWIDETAPGYVAIFINLN